MFFEFVIHSIFQNINKSYEIPMVFEFRIDIFNVHHKNAMFANPSRTLHHSAKASQIGIWCSGTKKCSQKYEINHFCLGIFSAIQPSEILPEIPPGIPLELSLEIYFEIRFELPLRIPPEIPLEIPPGKSLKSFLQIHLEILFDTSWNTY